MFYKDIRAWHLRKLVDVWITQIAFVMYASSSHQKHNHKTVLLMIKNAYRFYIGSDLGDQEKKRTPHICCISCAVTLAEWAKGKRRLSPFVVWMIWREPENHYSELLPLAVKYCYMLLPFHLSMCTLWFQNNPVDVRYMWVSLQSTLKVVKPH